MSVEDKIKVVVEKVVGKVKEIVGKVIGDDWFVVEGKFEQVKGNVCDVVENVKDVFKK